MFSWIYDVSSLLAIILFGAGFVAVFWLGLLLLRPFVRRLLPQERGLNATLTMYLQYFGIIYGLLPPTKITPRHGGRWDRRGRGTRSTLP